MDCSVKWEAHATSCLNAASDWRRQVGSAESSCSHGEIFPTTWPDHDSESSTRSERVNCSCRGCRWSRQ
eukprot:scaffold5910_cov103-Isochrysis_galbana.AAC.4